MSSPKRAAGLIVYRLLPNNLVEYLLLKASYPPYHWCPPKGHVDPGESEIETAFRETEEEAGLNRDDLEIKQNFEEVLKYEAFGSPKVVTYWTARLKTNKPVTLSKEHTDLVWVDLRKAKEYLQYPDIISVYEKCHNFIV